MQSGRLKVVISLAILVAGLAVTVAIVPSASTADSSSGLVVDFGGYETSYISTDPDSSPYDALEQLCSAYGYDLVYEDGKVVSIDGRSGDSERSWNLYGVIKGKTSWSVISGDCVLSDYSAVCYGLTTEGGMPSPAVDATGKPFYGYTKPTRVVSLAPSCTETLCSVGGMDIIVGTDRYSNYPAEIEDRRNSGEISEIGGFTNPSFEAILKLNPDLVVCISTQSVHLTTAEKLRNAGINVLVLDGGESVDAVLNSIHAAGVVLGTHDAAIDEINTLESQMTEIHDTIQSYDFTWEKRVMVALSAVKSPYISGSGTYIGDAMDRLFMINIFSDESGWVQVNAEMISRYDPEVIIIVSSDYEATQSEYDGILSSMSLEWRTTTAYKNGEIYLFAEDAADCASRAGPRVAQMMELMGRAVHGEAFPDGIEFPKFIGDDYKSYLPITGSGF